MFDIFTLNRLIEMKNSDNIEGTYVSYKREATGEVEKVFIGKIQYIFLHVPKTGGTYVARNKGVLNPIFDLNHSVLSDNPDQVPTSYPPFGYSREMLRNTSLINQPYRLCFATVRNPYDWFASYWYHCKADILNPDYRIAHKGFDYFISEIANRENVWPGRKLLYFVFFSYEGNFLIDRLIHQENLDFELEEFANESVDLWYTKNENKPRVSTGRDPDYRTYYSDSLVDLVDSTWYNDFMLFGYDFENGKVDGVFNKIVDKELKNKVKYSWNDDTLFIDDIKIV